MAQDGESCSAAVLQALRMQQFLLSLEQLSKPNSRDLCNAEDSDETTMFIKTKNQATPGKARFNNVNTVDGAIGLQSPVASRPSGCVTSKELSGFHFACLISVHSGLRKRQRLVLLVPMA